MQNTRCFQSIAHFIGQHLTAVGKILLNSANHAIPNGQQVVRYKLQELGQVPKANRDWDSSLSFCKSFKSTNSTRTLPENTAAVDSGSQPDHRQSAGKTVRSCQDNVPPVEICSETIPLKRTVKIPHWGMSFPAFTTVLGI